MYMFHLYCSHCLICICHMSFILVRNSIVRSRSNQHVVALIKETKKKNKSCKFIIKNNGDTPLHYAIRAGYVDIAKYLVEKGADVNAKDSNGNTVLYSAAKGYERSYGQADKQGYLNLVKLLVEKGANLKGALLFVGYGDVFEYLKGLGASYYRKRRSIAES